MGWLATAVVMAVAYDVLLRLILRDTPDIRLSSARWYAALMAVLLPFALAALAGIWVFQEVDAWRHTRSCVDPECAGRREVRA